MLVIAYYNNDGYRNMVWRLAQLCNSWGIPFRSYCDTWLRKQPEYRANIPIFSANKGAGYWAWKPLIILDALKSSDEVVYLDSSVVPVDKETICDFVKFTDRLCSIEYADVNKIWTKRACFVGMNCDYEKYWDAKHVWAGVVSAKDSSIVEEWKYYCLQYDIISDSPCENNFLEFKDHRHDQSILANIIIKHKQKYLINTKFLDVNNYSHRPKPNRFEEMV
jgi:hypothetical protein